MRVAEGTPVLKVQTANGMPRLWNRETCVPVTYAPSLEKFKATFQAALDAWDQVDCTGLCFDPPKQSKEVPVLDNDLRLHLADNGAGSGAGWELLSDGRTGRTLHATLFINNTSTVGEVLKQLGFVLGFESVKAQFRDTVLEEFRVPNPRTGLGELDKQSLCAVYTACR